jgi:NAD(P)-dependent dehydrogenase (short-subunit alcohol dehydrogenase family)
MDLGLAGRLAVVTGASRGLGQAIARELAAEGCNLVLCARDEAAVAELAGELATTHGVDVQSFRVDVTVSDDVTSFAEAVEGMGAPLDVLVNNAGRGFPGRFLKLTDENFVDDYAIKVLAHIRMIRSLLPLLEQSPSPRVININSIHGHAADPAFFTASVNRAASIALVKALALELADKGVLVNSVNIGFALTPQWHNIHERTRPDLGWEEFISDFSASHVPLKRMGKPEEVAGVVAFLASARASYLTGISVDVGGGYGVA